MSRIQASMGRHQAPSRIRVIVLRPTLGQGGADRVTLSLLQLLDRERFDVSLVLCRYEGDFLPDLPGDLPVRSLQVRSLWSACRPLARCFNDMNPDVVLSTSSGTNMVALVARHLSRRRFRIVLSERNVLYHGGKTIKRRLVVLLKRFLYGRADGITTVSEGVKRDLVEKLRLAPNRIEVVYNPVVTDELCELMKEPVEDPWFGDSVPIVLGAGRLVREKDFEMLIDAFARVRRHREARLVILGEGPLKSRLRRRVRRLGLEGDVWFPGFDKNPFRYMSRCSVFVLSSRDEGLPGVLIQAMACGAAVVSTDCHAGPREIITPGVDGWLVPVGDDEELAARIDYYLSNPDIRRRMAESARLASDRFRADVVLPNYERALTRSSPDWSHRWVEQSV